MVEKIFFIFVLLLVINNCVKMESKFGKEFNEERKIVGLPIIADNWELYTVARDYSVWVNPERQAKNKNRIPGSLSNRDTRMGGGEGDIIISLEEAEKVLEKWGIKRLSYDFTKTKAK